MGIFCSCQFCLCRIAVIDVWEEIDKLSWFLLYGLKPAPFNGDLGRAWQLLLICRIFKPSLMSAACKGTLRINGSWPVSIDYCVLITEKLYSHWNLSFCVQEEVKEQRYRCRCHEPLSQTNCGDARTQFLCVVHWGQAALQFASSRWSRSRFQPWHHEFESSGFGKSKCSISGSDSLSSKCFTSFATEQMQPKRAMEFIFTENTNWIDFSSVPLWLKYLYALYKDILVYSRLWCRACHLQRLWASLLHK